MADGKVSIEITADSRPFMKTLSALARQATAGAAAAASAFAAGIAAGQGAVLSAGQRLASAARSGMQSGGWYSVGYNIASGIAGGIYGGSGAIRSAAYSAAQSALRAAKKSLGIRSPSAVFREEVGKMIPAGIAEGMEAGQREAVLSARALSAALTAAAAPTIEGSIRTDMPSGVLPELSPASAAPIEITVPLEVDGHEIARATAAYTGGQMRWGMV